MESLVNALRRHVRLLKAFYEKAFKEHDQDYQGEVAAKLRLLVYEKGRNKALLLRLMDEFAADPIVKIQKPEGVVELPLRVFLAEVDHFPQRPGCVLVKLSKVEFLNIWAVQAGAAHEDWEHAVNGS